MPEKISKTDINRAKLLRKQLNTLASACQGDDRPNCPILDALSEILSNPVLGQGSTAE